MEKLKSALADKIIDISSGSEHDIKYKLEKIHRFRDFTNACQSLMEKYPLIEQELLLMVNNDDYDTKVASSRVDAAIRLADTVSNQPDIKTEADISELKQISNTINDTFNSVVEPLEQSVIDEASEYVDYEDIESNKSTQQSDIVIEAEDLDSLKSVRKERIRKLIQISGVIFIIIILIFVVKFVLHNWQTIVWILAIAAILAILIRLFIKRNKGK